MGRILSSSQTIGGQTYTIGYGWDRASERTSFTFPSGRIETTAFDQAGRINGVTGTLLTTSTPYVSSVLFWPNGLINSQSLGDQAFEQNCQNNLLTNDRCPRRNNRSRGYSELRQHGIGYDRRSFEPGDHLQD